MARDEQVMVVGNQPVYSSYRNETWFPSCGHVVDGEKSRCSLCCAASEAERRFGSLVPVDEAA